MLENKFLKDNINFLRKSKNLNQKGFADLIGKKTSVVSSYETGVSVPPVDVLLFIANSFNISIDDLLNKDLSKVSKEEENTLNVKKHNFKKNISVWYDDDGNKVDFPFDPSLINDSFDVEFENNFKLLQSIFKQLLSLASVLKKSNRLSDNQILRIDNINKLIEDSLETDLTGLIRMNDDIRKGYNEAIKKMILVADDLRDILISSIRDIYGYPIYSIEDLTK